EALDLCVSCKGCKRECPTGVDMARMKIEFRARERLSRGLSLRDRVIAHLPRHAPWASRAQPLLGALSRLPGAGALIEATLGFDRRRPLPAWRKSWVARQSSEAGGQGRPVVLFPDTFNNWFEPENLDAAMRVLEAAGYEVTVARASDGKPLCCG